MGKLGIRILVGVPRLSAYRLTDTWMEAYYSLQMPLGSSLARVRTLDLPIAEARNELCRQALEIGADYLVMVGDDVIVPANMLLAMLDKIGREFPVEGGGVARASMVTGVYWTKTYPTEPYLWRGLYRGSFRDWTAGDFLPVDFAGCDALMIETAMLRALPEPWFSTDWRSEPGQESSSIATEDFFFYSLARQHGYRLFADTGVQCLHEDRQTGHLFGLTTDMPQVGAVPECGDDELLVADIGAGDDSPYFGERCTVVRFDGREDTRPDCVCDLAAIPDRYRGQFDVVHTRHVLEHFGRAEQDRVLGHWAELLKDDGAITVRVPNLGHAFDVIGRARANPGTVPADAQHYAWQQIYGGQGNPYDYHRAGFVAETLAALMRGVPGLADVTVEEENEGQNLKATARKIATPSAPALSEMWEEIRARESTPAPEPIPAAGNGHGRPVDVAEVVY